MKPIRFTERIFGKKTNIFEVISVSHKFVKLFGYLCFSFRNEWPNTRVTFTLLDVVMFAANLSLNAFLLYDTILFDDTDTGSVIFTFGIRFILVSLIVIGVISSLLNVLFSGKIFQLFKCFREFDTQIVTVGGRINHQKHFMLLNGLAIVVPNLIFLFLLSDVITGDMSIYKVLSLLAPVMSFVVTKGILIFLLSSLRMRFEVLNKCFRDNFCTSDAPVKMVKSLDDKEKSNPSLLVTKFATLHDYMSDASELTSLCYAFQAMIFTGLCFVYNVFIIFSIFRVWMYYSDHFLGLVIGQAHWAFITSGFAIGEIYVAHNVTKLGKYTAILAHKAINLSTDASSIDKLKQMANQINHRPPVITCGLFFFDWTLFYSLCGASTTYLVILIQFDSSMVTDGPNSTMSTLTPLTPYAI
ncbi:hypothetical protein DMENIID0001_043060 [Sergentomyia squamirostris]